MKLFTMNQISITLKLNLELNNLTSIVSFISNNIIKETATGNLDNQQDLTKFQQIFSKHKNTPIVITIENFIPPNEEPEEIHNKLEQIIIKIMDYKSTTTDLNEDSKEKIELQNWLNYLATLSNPVKSVNAIYNGITYKIRNKEIYSLIITDMLNYYLTLILSVEMILVGVILLSLHYRNNIVEKEIIELKNNIYSHSKEKNINE